MYQCIGLRCELHRLGADSESLVDQHHPRRPQYTAPAGKMFDTRSQMFNCYVWEASRATRAERGHGRGCMQAQGPPCLQAAQRPTSNCAVKCAIVGTMVKQELGSRSRWGTPESRFEQIGSWSASFLVAKRKPRSAIFGKFHAQVVEIRVLACLCLKTVQIP